MKYKLVPIEPTQDMERAAESYWNERRFKGLSDDPRTWAGVYQAMLAAAPTVEQKPSLVAWILYSATTDEKYIKMNPADGSLAFYDNEEAAISAKRLHSGTDYKRCAYYSDPQPAPEVAKLVEALEEIIHPVRFMKERLEEGERLNGMVAVQLAKDAEYLRGIAIAALDAHRKQGGARYENTCSRKTENALLQLRTLPRQAL